MELAGEFIGFQNRSLFPRPERLHGIPPRSFIAADSDYSLPYLRLQDELLAQNILFEIFVFFSKNIMTIQ
jgi:hypothetical protein